MSSPLPSASQLLQNAQLEVSQGRYDYYMLQLPSNILVSGKRIEGHELATFLQEKANELSKQGWEFYRIDQLNAVANPGCLGSLFGGGQQFVPYSIMTFRRFRRMA
jgi:hypothetical protein